MLLLRCLFLAIASVTLLLGVCESSDSSADDQMKALSAAVAYVGDDPNNLPPIGQFYDCQINPVRQPTPPANTIPPVGARCYWDVARQGEQWLVTFNEIWPCRAWNGNVPGYPACDGVTGSHFWEYVVDLKANTVQLINDRGQFAPDM